jgi:hypothetical protein
MKLTEQELKNVRETNAAVQDFKLRLGELELQKAAVLARVSVLQSKFEELEAQLTVKYGADSVINLKTGEVKTNGQD